MDKVLDRIYAYVQNEVQKCRMNTQILHFSPKNKEKNLLFAGSCGADDQIRTGDLILTKDALYRLSYISASLERKQYDTTSCGLLQ